MISSDLLQSLPRVRHGFLTRKGGVSRGIFSALNCGYGSGDNTEDVRENRERAAAEIGLKAGDLASAYQVHSADVLEVTEPWSLDERPKVDALVTRQPGVALGILTADCVPVLFADADAGVVGAAHAGWKGALSGVVQATVDAMEKIGAARANIRATIGPCIRQPSYEVGLELRDAFTESDPETARFFIPSVRDGHYMFDLAGFVRASAEKSDIGSVGDVERDTYAEEELFFSYRRTTHRKEADYGRGISLISLERD